MTLGAFQFGAPQDVAMAALLQRMGPDVAAAIASALRNRDNDLEDYLATIASAVNSGSGAITVCTSATRPASPYVGQVIFETDTGKLLEYQSATTGWTPPWNTAWGQVPSGYVLQSGTIAGVASTANVDVTGLTFSFTPVANRLHRVSWFFFVQSTSGADVATAVLNVDGVQLGQNNLSMGGTANWALGLVGCERLSLTAVLHTIKMQVHRDTGTGTISGPVLSASYPQFMLVEDIGPNGAPV